MALVNMQMSAEEAKAEYTATPADNDLPKYPYGLSLNLDDEVLAKLGLTPPPVGTKMTLTAVVEVCTVSQYENQDGKEANLSLQITDMELASAGKDAASVLWPD